MRDLLSYIVTNIVSKPDEVKIEEENNQGNVDLFLTVDPSDMGLIIGKGGQTIRAIRKLLTVRAIVENVRVNLQLVETNPPASKEESTSDVIPGSEATPESEDAGSGPHASGESMTTPEVKEPEAEEIATSPAKADSSQ